MLSAEKGVEKQPAGIEFKNIYRIAKYIYWNDTTGSSLFYEFVLRPADKIVLRRALVRYFHV